MIEMAALLVMIERCAPDAPIKPLVAAVREASGFEPLVLATRQNGRMLSVQASSRAEAIALATEMKLAGQPVRLGLAGVDAREFDRRNIPIGEAFDSCTSLRLAGALLARTPTPLATEPERVALPRRVSPALPARHDSASNLPADDAAVPAPPSADAPAPKAWDVYGRARAGTALVYGALP